MIIEHQKPLFMATNNDNVKKNAYFIYRLTLGDMILSKTTSTLELYNYQ